MRPNILNRRDLCLGQMMGMSVLDLNYNLMDPLLIIGDLIHIIALIYLLVTIVTTRSAAGVSYRTQEMFLVVFLTRFSDIIIMDHPFHLQLVLVRTILIAATITTIYLIRLRLPYSKMYNKETDSFPKLWIYAATTILSIAVPENSSLYGYLWTFSIWLEAFSIVPQLSMIFNETQIKSWAAKFVWMLAIYRTFYLIHWIVYWEHAKMHGIIAEIIQIIIYGLFLYQHMARRKIVEFMALPP